MLDVNGASTTPGAPVIQWFRNDGSNQRWNVILLPNNYSELIVNQNSGLCLTSDGVASHWVYQWPCDASNRHQFWQGDLASLATAGNKLENLGSGLYLDVDGNSPWPGAHLITWYWDDTQGELFGD